MPLRLLFPLACPLPPLLRLLPTPAGARFYSPSRLATSLVTPTSRRPINRHGLLSRRTYIPQQPSHIKPTIEEIKEWNEDELLKWIQQKRPGLLRGDNLEKFKAAFIRGAFFVKQAGDVGFFKKECNLPIGISGELADLAREIAGGETAGTMSKLLSFIPCTPRRQQANNVTGNTQQAGDAEMSDTASKSLLSVERLADLMRKIAVRETAGRYYLSYHAHHVDSKLTTPVDAEEAFKTGIEYKPPRPLVKTRGVDWTFQPHPELYETLATNVLEHYDHYKKDEIDKTYIPAYFYLGGAGTGKSRHGLEFASSVQEAITLRTQHPLYHELAQRLKKAFVFHVSFENGTPLTVEEMSNPWNAIGTRMLQQLLSMPIDHIRKRYVADPAAIFRLVAAAENVDLYDDFTGILVVDGIQRALREHSDGNEKTSVFYGLLNQISGLSLLSRGPSETKEGTLREAPFIMTCVTATCFGPVQGFLADTHRKRVYLPLNRLQPPTYKNDKSPVFNDSPATRLLVNDVGGHARAIELIADELAMCEKGDEPNITELANDVYTGLKDRYREALDLLREHTLPIAQCILSRRQIRLQDVIPGSNVKWEDVVSSGLIWFERTETDYDYGTQGYLVAPYIWLWVLARLPASESTERLRRFLRTWKFNDYEELLHLETDQGLPGNTFWQSFEVFCCLFRILRSLGFEDGQEVPLKLLYSGCKLRDDQETMVVNRHLDFARAAYRYGTDSIAEKAATTHGARSAEEVDTRHSGTLNADDQLSHIILNAASAPAGDFFNSIETSAQRSPKRKGSQGNIVREVGQCKLIQKGKLTQDMYDAEREKSAGPDDIFMLYTKTKISDDFALPDRSGLVDASCWDSYFGPFAGRAYMVSRCAVPKDVTKK